MRLASVVTALIVGALVGGAGAQPASALFPITVNDKHYGYLDRTGTWVISPRFVWVRPFHNGLAFVGPAGSRGTYIDTKGRVVWESR